MYHERVGLVNFRILEKKNNCRGWGLPGAQVNSFNPSISTSDFWPCRLLNLTTHSGEKNEETLSRWLI
jgi:hypothetical protein